MAGLDGLRRSFPTYDSTILWFSFTFIITINNYEPVVKIYHQSHVGLKKSLGFTQQTK